VQLGNGDRPRLESFFEVAQIHREGLGGKNVLESLLGQPALHRHLTTLEAEARAMVTGAGLLTLDALA
jgi:hypothetical protein